MMRKAKQGRWLDVGYSLIKRTTDFVSSILGRWVYLLYLSADSGIRLAFD